MSSMFNFYVKVLKKENTKLYLTLSILNSEQDQFYDGKNFALQIIWHKKRIDEKSEYPLYKK